MKKNVLLAATMAAVLASCSSDDMSLQSSKQETAQDGQVALAFDALAQRSISTRAGHGGEILNDSLLKESVENGGGFGVFAYQTKNNMEYTDGLNAEMRLWNEKVYYDNGSWSYQNVQYWTNEFGSDAQSDDIRRMSFFAYAPYVDATVNGKVADIESGITGFTSNTTMGDPYVKYVASFLPSKSVDLCWGVCDEESWDIIQGGATQEMKKGLPWLDLQRPAKAIGQKVKFTFKHALAQLNVQIDADPDIEDHDEESKIADGTKVYVRSITFSGFAQKGALNLNNDSANMAKWEAYNCCSEELKSESVTLYDGRKDANPGVAGAVANGEKLQCLNPTIISNDGNTTEGVTEKPKNLFNNTSVDAPVYVIPTDDEITVTITYGIETVDDHLAGYLSDKQTHGHWKDYTITKQVKFGEATKLENGKKYTLNIHLALNSIKFDADVTDWDDTAEAGDVYLPSNVAKGVSLNKSTLLLEPNGEETLTATVTPSDAVDKTVTWTSSDETVAIVDESGKVTAKAAGRASIIATSSAGQKATCDVIVSVALGNSEVGMFIGQDGKAYKDILDAQEAGTEAKAYIFYKVDTAGESRAISLTNETSGHTTWNSFNSNPGWTSAPSCDAISGATWQWPTKADLEELYEEVQNMSTGNGVFPDERSLLFWCITEDDNDTNMTWGLYVNIRSKTSAIRYSSKDVEDIGYTVRAVLAF